MPYHHNDRDFMFVLVISFLEVKAMNTFQIAKKSWMSLAWPYKPRIQQLYFEEKCASILLKWSKFLHLRDLNVTNLEKKQHNALDDAAKTEEAWQG